MGAFGGHAQVPTDLRAQLSLYSSWTDVENGGNYLLTGFVQLVLPDSALDQAWGVLFESEGGRFVTPAASFQERFRRVRSGDPK
jgi:hypothetical protein